MSNVIYANKYARFALLMSDEVSYGCLETMAFIGKTGLGVSQLHSFRSSYLYSKIDI